jgi:diguanylate cyclase (GGDEF)-like protein/PAS domain S-box-containing protein
VVFEAKPQKTPKHQKGINRSRGELVNSSGISFILPYLGAALISGAVGVLALRRRIVPGAASFAVLTLAEAAWTGSYVCQRVTLDLPGQIFWNNLQLSAALVAVLGYLGFVLQYTRVAPPRTRALRPWLSLLGFALGGLVWTDGAHHLVRTASHLEPGLPFTRLVYQDGPLFFLLTVFIYGLIAYSTFLLVVNFFSSSRLYRLQIGTVLLGVFIPWGISLLAFTGLVPFNLHDITPLAFAPSNLLMFWALFRFYLFDVAPIARELLVERLQDGVIVLDQRWRIVDFNPTAREIFGFSNTATLGKYIRREQPVLYQFITRLVETPNARTEMSVEVLGMPSRYEVMAVPLYHTLGTLIGYLVTLRDITEQKRTEDKLQRLAQTDYLTEVYNRRAFFELAAPELERSRRYHHSLAFILMDVDNFKKVNDTYGHLVGDRVLQNVARACQRSLREVDKLARYGGEEFIVMLPETDGPGACRSAERLRQVIEGAEISTHQGPVRITASLGVAVIPPDCKSLTIDRLLGRADQALYQAKQAGRNQVCLWQEEWVTSEVLSDGKTGGIEERNEE